MAKRKSNWETLKHPFPNKRRAQLFVNQGHAYDHCVDRCSNKTGKIPNPPTYRDMACPICGEVKGFNDFTEDHCPQRGGQSNFGGPSCIVLVCRSCNGIPGKSYEGRTAQMRKGDRSSDNRIMHGSYDVHGNFTADGIADSSEMATDQKTAFLVAFAALGYRFALDPMYNHIRTSIYEGSTPPTGPIPAKMLVGLEDESVYEHANGVVTVVGRDYGWMLSPLRARPSSEKHGRRRWDWPETHSRGNRQHFAEHFASGGLFHADFCTNPNHHTWGPQALTPTGVISVPPAT